MEKEMRIYLLLAFCLPAFAQTTTVTGTIRDPAGDPLSGACSVQAVGPFTAASGWRVIGAPTVVRFSGGAFTFALAPTDSATPAGQYYKVTCSVPQQTVNGRSVGPFSWGPRYWLIPTNANSLDIGTVEMTSPPPGPSWLIQWQQLAQNGAQVGQAPVWNGYSWQPANPPSAAWGSVAGRLTDQADLQNALAAKEPAAPPGTASQFWRGDKTWGTVGFADLGGAASAAQLPDAGGDLSGPLTNATVARLQGNAVSNTVPADGQMMRWSASAGQWQPVRVRYTATFANAATITVLGGVHQLGTADLTITCYDASTPPNVVEPSSWISDPVTFDVTIYFAVALSGRCVLR
jgi:hypothetical protein